MNDNRAGEGIYCQLPSALNVIVIVKRFKRHFATVKALSRISDQSQPLCLLKVTVPGRYAVFANEGRSLQAA